MVRLTGMKAGLTGVVGLLALALVAGCGSGVADSSVVAARAPASRPVVTHAQLTEAATGTTRFGLDVFGRLAGGNGNVVMSPASLATVLAMLLPGARGATATAIATVLHDRLPAADYAAAVGALQAASPGAGATLRESDSLWTQKGMRPSAAYLRLLAADFVTGVHETDFRADAERARQAINAEVAGQTDDIIKELFPKGSIDASTLLVLVNAIYLHAAWLHPFDPGQTSPQSFRLLNGKTVTVPTMSDGDDFGYASGPGWQAAELPYRGGQLAMDIVMPASGFTAFRDRLTGTGFTSMLARLRSVSVALSLPRFTVSSDTELTRVLTGLGMGVAFGPGADFSGLGLRGGSVSTVIQDAYIQVGEKGTTAAAATGAAIATAGRATQATMTVDRPFLFAIRNLHTGQILFLGQVTHP
jgi:serpin B